MRFDGMENITVTVGPEEITEYTSEPEKKIDFKFYITIIFIGIALAMMRSLKYFLSEDYMWHYKIGEYMVKNKEFFSVDTFSWLSKEGLTNQFTYSWLGDIVTYWFTDTFATSSNPYFGLWLCERLFYAITLILVLWSARKFIPRLKTYSTTSYMLILLPTLLIYTMSPRPQLFSNVLFVIMLYLFQEWDNGNVKYIYALPVITLIWANIHGATAFLPIAFALAHLVCSRINLCRGQIRNVKKDFNDTKHLGVATVLAILTAMINPYKWNVLVYFLLYKNDAVKNYVTEMQPATITNSFAIVLALALAAFFVLSSKKYSLHKLIPVVSMTLMTLLHVRGCYYLALAASFFVVYILERPPVLYKNNEPDKFYKAASTMIFCILAFGAVAISNKVLSQADTIVNRDYTFIDKEIIETIKENEYERLYNSYNTGGYLIYNEIPVFIDSRAELYTEETLSDAMKLFYWDCKDSEMEEIMNKYGFDAYLVEIDTPFYKYMSNNDNYIEIVSDDNFSLMESRE